SGDPPGHGLGWVRHRVQAYTRGEIDQAGRHARLYELMSAACLQRVPDCARRGAVIDDQRPAAAPRDPSTDLERDVVGAPFEDVADLGCAQPAWQKLIEQRDRITMDAEM